MCDILFIYEYYSINYSKFRIIYVVKKIEETLVFSYLFYFFFNSSVSTAIEIFEIGKMSNYLSH